MYGSGKSTLGNRLVNHSANEHMILNGPFPANTTASGPDSIFFTKQKSDDGKFLIIDSFGPTHTTLEMFVKSLRRVTSLTNNNHLCFPKKSSNPR